MTVHTADLWELCNNNPDQRRIIHMSQCLGLYLVKETHVDNVHLLQKVE